MRKTYQLTDDGRKDLEKELNILKGRRGDIADKIAEARDYGDLSENAEYDTAREEQGLVETRIAEIEEILLNAERIERGKKGEVSLGSNVTLKSADKNVTYAIVSPIEANPGDGKISDHSPIGQALIGKKISDEVTITTPKGETKYEIIAID